MPLQDLTPQLRTRLGRVERAVGLFVTLATALLLAGFGYYVYHTAKRKGWLVNKVPYFTFVQDAAGLKVGDPVKLMGFDAGEITEITPMDPGFYYNVYVQFLIRSPHYGYLWKDSHAKITAADFLGKRSLEVTKGSLPPVTVLETNKLIFGRSKKVPWGILDDKSSLTNSVYMRLTKQSKGYFLPPEESPALTERLDQLIQKVEDALPDILGLTNQLAGVLTNGAMAATNLNFLLANAQPAARNLAVITEHLKNPHGSLGEWLFPTNLNQQLQLALTNANTTLTNFNTTLSTVETNLASLVENLNRSLDNLAGITSNLNAQVQANTNILAEISGAIVHTDDLIQGLKRHWLLRSAFRQKPTNAPPLRPLPPKTGQR